MEPAGRPPHVMREVGSTLTGYVSGQLKVAGILCLLYMVGFALARVPAWPLVGIVCGALNVVPVFGSLIALGVAGFAVLLGEGDLYQYLGALIVFVVVQGIEGFWLTPRILGRRLQLSPLTVFFVILAGGALFGFVGVLLAVPVAAVAAVLWRALARRMQA